MAEKYGTVPPKFTKSWWEYFWMYYKWHTIITVFLVIAIASTIYQNVTAPKYDITLMYAGKKVYSEETATSLSEKLSPMCEDVDKNEESSLLFSQLNIDLNTKSDGEYLMAMITKLQLSLAEDDVYLYIMDEETAKYCLGEDTENAIFAPLDDYLTSDTDNLEKFTVNGIEFGIKLNDCEFFDQFGDSFNEQYLFLRYYPREDQKKRQLAGYEASIKLANEILSK